MGLGQALATLNMVLGSAGPHPKHSVAVQNLRDIEAGEGAVRAERIAFYSMAATVAAAVAALLTAIPIIRSWF